MGSKFGLLNCPLPIKRNIITNKEEARLGDLYVDKKQVFQGGFRDYNLDKYIEKLHPHGYTIVVYVQDGSGDDIKRVQHGIYSPGTTFLEQTQTLSNNMSCIWIQKVKTFLNQEQYVFGMSNINLMSGHSYVCENYENSLTERSQCNISR